MKVTHDFHIHTNLSLCAEQDTTVEYYVRRAEEIGLTKIGFANHFWDEKVEGANESDACGEAERGACDSKK